MKELHHDRDDSVDIVSGAKKNPAAVASPRSAARVHQPFHGTSADGNFNIISNEAAGDRANRAVSPRNAQKSPEPAQYDPVNGQEVGRRSSLPKSTSGHFRAEMKSAHTDVNPVTGEKIDKGAKQDKVSHGHLKHEIASTHKDVDPILGQPKGAKSPVPASRKFGADDVAGVNKGPQVSYNPLTGAEQSSAPVQRSTSGAFKNEMASTHSNVNPITGEKIAPTSPQVASAGAFRNEMRDTHANVDPILGNPKANK